MLFTAAGAFALNDIPPSGVTAPPKGPTPEYGRYIAEGVFDCGGCHTPGFAADKMNGDAAFAGGFQFADPAGRKIYSANLTFDESGLGGWTLDEFQTTLTTGLRRDGSALRFPMPKYRMLDAVETEAIYRYLQTLPKRHNVVEGRHVMGAAIAATSTGPAQIYTRLGCAECHDAGAPYREQLVAAKGKHPSDLARWIRNPEAYKPGTAMPTYAGRLSESDAEKLAAWIVAGGV
jgi:mono/diheme cytochrome c family protein